MSEGLCSRIDRLRADGALVLLEWAGEHASNRCTIVVTRAETDHGWRGNTDDIAATAFEALADYPATHPARST